MESTATNESNFFVNDEILIIELVNILMNLNRLKDYEDHHIQLSLDLRHCNRT